MEYIPTVNGKRLSLLDIIDNSIKWELIIINCNINEFDQTSSHIPNITFCPFLGITTPMTVISVDIIPKNRLSMNIMCQIPATMVKCYIYNLDNHSHHGPFLSKLDDDINIFKLNIDGDWNYHNFLVSIQQI